MAVQQWSPKWYLQASADELQSALGEAERSYRQSVVHGHKTASLMWQVRVERLKKALQT
jgi:hypothetical protein